MKLFDAAGEYVIPAFGRIKECVLRYPTDQQLCDRVRKIKTIEHHGGRDASRTETLGETEANRELFEAIRVDQDGPAFDDAEVAAAFDKVDCTRLLEVEREGDNYKVSLRVLNGVEVTHTLKPVSQRQLDDIRRQSTSRKPRGRFTEVRSFLDPAGPLYDTLVVKSEGYVGRVPINHKVVVINLVIQEMMEMMEEPDPEAPGPSGPKPPVSAGSPTA